MKSVCFWQKSLSPHMSHLARELAMRGIQVTCAAGESMSAQRASMGWEAPDIRPARFVPIDGLAAARDVLTGLPTGCIHICQGLRANGYIGAIQKDLVESGRRQWAILETVRDDGAMQPLRRMEYARLLRAFDRVGEGILAIGHTMPRWLMQRGFPPEKIVPFAYFLPETRGASHPPASTTAFRVGFAGRLVKLKRVDLLIEAFVKLAYEDPDRELWIMGDGPDRVRLERYADKLGASGITWHGSVALTDVPRLLNQIDCLVLPSHHDGWGAVISEALMVGTPAICSDRCGAAGAVVASGVGGVFPADDRAAFGDLLGRAAVAGPVAAMDRARIRQWAHCLSAEAGAAYLDDVLFGAQNRVVVRPPWQQSAAAL